MKKISGLKIRLLWLKVKVIGAISKLCRIMKKTVIYQSKTGLKEINPVFHKRDDSGAAECALSPNELYLGIDFLKDHYSLIDVPITESPHLGLMKELSEGGDGRACEYVRRMLGGSLDERYEIVAFYLDRNYFRNCFEKRMREIESDNGECVVAYKHNDRYYIHDGKHRAALCALLGVDVKCKIIDFSAVCADFNSKKIAKLMKRGQYTKHQSIFSAIGRSDEK